MTQGNFLKFQAVDDNFGIPKVNPDLSFAQFAQASAFTIPQRQLPTGLQSHPNPHVSPAPATDGALKGTGPAMYDGDKNKAQEFMREFQLWWMQNDNNTSFKTPYHRIALFLGKMRGPKVTSWIDLMMRELNNQLGTNPALRTDEVLWIEFQKKFDRKFTSASAIEEAQLAFEKLKMEDEDIDAYVASFEELLSKVGWERTDSGVLQKFQGGLRKWLVGAILNRDVWPENLDEWIDAARREL